jgi:hypothetical protein
MDIKLIFYRKPKTDMIHRRFHSPDVLYSGSPDGKSPDSSKRMVNNSMRNYHHCYKDPVRGMDIFWDIEDGTGCAMFSTWEQYFFGWDQTLINIDQVTYYNTFNPHHSNNIMSWSRIFSGTSSDPIFCALSRNPFIAVINEAGAESRTKARQMNSDLYEVKVTCL